MRAGLDVGGTKIDAVLLDDDDTVVARVRRATGWGPEAVQASMSQAVRELRAAAGAAGAAELRAIGVGIPGVIDQASGRVLHAVNLGLEELDVRAALAAEWHAPVHVENDVKAAALGAWRLHHPDRTSLGYLNLGTGIAAGCVLDGALWRGVRGAAGEIGHISVDPLGPLCRCGQRGCIEAFAGGAAVAARWGHPSGLPVRDVFDAADAGDARAAGLRDELVFAVGAAVRVLVMTADVFAVTLGGGITALGDRLLAPLRESLAASGETSAFLRSLDLPARVELLPTGSPAAAVGAALLSNRPQESAQEVVPHG